MAIGHEGKMKFGKNIFENLLYLQSDEEKELRFAFVAVYLFYKFINNNYMKISDVPKKCS